MIIRLKGKPVKREICRPEITVEYEDIRGILVAVITWVCWIIKRSRKTVVITVGGKPVEVRKYYIIPKFNYVKRSD